MFPWKIVTIVSKLVYDLFAELTCNVVIIRLLSISRTSQYDPFTIYTTHNIPINEHLKPPPRGYIRG